MPQKFDLSTVFGEITKTLIANKQELNEADTTNHNHGDNMVKTFQTARRAVVASKTKSPAQQLDYAAARLKKTAKSGSGQIYAEGFTRAAKIFEGKSVTPDSIGTLIEALMGSDQPTQPQQQQTLSSQGGGGDLLSTLLGSLIGGQTTQQAQQQQSSQGEGDLLTDLLGGLMGGGQQTQQTRPESQQSQGSGDVLTDLLGGLMGGGQRTQQSQPQQSQLSPEDLIGSLLGGLSGGSDGKLANQKNGLDAGELLSGALKYYAAKKSGSSNLEAIMSALSKSSPLGGTPERTQSGALVIQTLMKMLGNAR